MEETFQGVPIMVLEDETHIFLTEAIENPTFYAGTILALRTASAEDTVYLHINTPGGSLDTALMIRDAIKKSKGTVIGVLSGHVVSAGTVIACACDELEVGDDLSFMCHAYSGTLEGTSTQMEDIYEFRKRNFTTQMNNIYGNFLTPDEIKRLINGRDVWLNSEEVRERWQNKHSACFCDSPGGCLFCI